ncbi:MAG: hypothetical protein HY703_01275 [Gemmatimonadetes bacterium]|nr:hypothetical protein [Gemmatimonadota bacterium]
MIKRLMLALLLCSASSLEAQEARRSGPPFSIAGGAHLQSYRFSEGIGAASARLILFPIALQAPVGRWLLLELYNSYAMGEVGLDGAVHRLESVTDTWLRTTLHLRPGVALTLGFNLPTGKATHQPEEAVVATVMSTDLLGFREASWGLGFAATGGLTTAVYLGRVGLSLGASFRRNGEFRPRTDTAIVYLPGDEMRARAALEYRGDVHQFSVGVMGLEYTQDRLDGRNLFQAGRRLELDATWSFPLGRTSWTVFATDIWRDRGDVTLPIITQGATVRRDSTFSVGRQNLVVAGIGGSISLRGRLAVRPSADFRYQLGEQIGADGWVVSAGLDVPVLRPALELFPSARALLGAIQDPQGRLRSVRGGELGLVIRH